MKISEEIKHCLDGDGCDKCGRYEERSVMTCRGLLQAAYEEIKKNEEVEEQGKLVMDKRLPGDYVWIADEKRNAVSEHEIVWALRDKYGYLQPFYQSDIGKTVFLTTSDAESVLKEKKESEYSPNQFQEMIDKCCCEITHFNTNGNKKNK